MVLSFGFAYLRPITRKRENLSLGKYPSLSIADARKILRNFENHIFPKLSHKPIDQINAPETISVLKP